MTNAGARFLRADLHIHTFPDSDTEPRFPLANYLNEAVNNEIAVLGVTDHNVTRNARAAVEAAQGMALLVLPGIEITTHQGHLLAFFSPDALDVLEEFASRGNLRFTEDPRDKSIRSPRSILDLVGDIHERGGLAIPAHVDLADGICGALSRTELVELLSHPGLAGLEFGRSDALATWFTESDSDDARRDAWLTRRTNSELRARGLARIMSSDAHAPGVVGRDRASRTLTRLRLDDPNYEAVRNALLFNPRGRCKAEALLPLNYPWILGAKFEGGFLDGVEIDLSENLTCFIGGRGSGKSTALIAMRAALGADVSGDDPDDAERMPSVTTLRFIDRLGSERTVVRRIGQTPVEESTGAPISLAVSDLGQDESGRLARGYEDAPEKVLAFLDKFCDLTSELEREAELLAALAENEGEVVRTSTRTDQIEKLDRERQTLEASLDAAQRGRIEEIATWAQALASQMPFLAALETAIRDASTAAAAADRIDLEQLAADNGVDLAHQSIKEFVEGETGLRAQLGELETKISEARKVGSKVIDEASAPALEILEQWKEHHEDLKNRLSAKQKELEAQGLRVEAGEAVRIATRLNTVRTELARLRDMLRQHRDALRDRQARLTELDSVRGAIYEKRRASLRRVVDAANAESDGLRSTPTLSRAVFETSGRDG